MEKLFKFGALAVLLGTAGVAQADLATTTGGVTVKTEDGRFEAKFGGRIHLDTNTPLDDDGDNVEEGIAKQNFDAFFRRARLTLEGKAYGWSYKFENDFASQTDSVTCTAQSITVPEPTAPATTVTVTRPLQTCTGGGGRGFREMWIGTRLGEIANVRFGQAKPYRTMEELTSSNEILFMERPFASSTSLFGSRQYLLGIFLDGAGTHWGWGVSAHNLKAAQDSETDGVGTSARLYFAPVMTDTAVFHIGVSGSLDNPQGTSAVATSSVPYAGRSGPTQSLAATTADEQTTYGVELAGKAGPFYAQAEYAMAQFSEGTATDDIDVDTYYVQLGWLITGETKPYDVKKGVFKSPKPKNASGAWEAKYRYDFIENDGVAAAAEREVTQHVVGLNWYINPAVRMMFEYITGETEPSVGDKSSLDVFATRLQIGF